MAAPWSSTNHSRTPTFASQDSTSSTAASRNAALLGASTAFGRNTPKPKAQVNTRTGGISAKTAAFTAGSGSTNASPRHSFSMAHPPPLFPHSTGGSARSSRNNSLSLPPNPIASLGLPPASSRGYSRSPSQQAASLAASRAPPSANASPDHGSTKTHSHSSRKPSIAPKPRRLSEFQKQNEPSEGEAPTDSTPIAPTTSLVDLFERKSGVSSPTDKRPDPIVIKPSPDLAIKSPKPMRSSGGITSLFQMELEGNRSTSRASSSARKEGSSGERGDRPPLAHRTSHNPTSGDAEKSSANTSFLKPDIKVSRSLAADSSLKTKGEPSRSPLQDSTASAIDIQKPAPPTATAPLELFPASPASLKCLPAQYNTFHPRKMTPNLTGDQLANAMVAGSLASSRAPSPKKKDPAPPPPPTRRARHHHAFSFSRTPSPAKTGMLHTLRKTASDSDDDDDEVYLHPYSKHKKKRHLRKHPNKHHEGDRKRWRDAVTERERKRYEGVWAANKGMYCSFSKDEETRFQKLPSERARAQESLPDEVCNIVVRDIWNRSRLPVTTLEMVWDLVDHGNVGRLGKEEFVVGMWLIDQRLKGRKLPTKVSESVWVSVRSLQGIKIRK